MRLLVAADLTYAFDTPAEVLLQIEASHGPEQAVVSESLSISPTVDIARLDDAHSGERRAVFTASGEVSIAYRAEVTVHPADHTIAGLAAPAVRNVPGDAIRYLWPSRYCPSDRFAGFVEREFGRFAGGDKVEAMLAWIREHITYCSGVSTSMTTAQDTFIDRAGVCRDFAHLAVTLCRAADIPARMVSAHAWDLKPADMHAVAEVYLGGAWRLIDPTGRAPVEGLVRISTGLDAGDVSFMTVFGTARLLRQSFTVSEASPA